MSDYNNGFGGPPPALTNGNGALVPVPFANYSPLVHHHPGTTPPTPPNSANFGHTTFLHGMHSFRSAEELQFYLDQIGGPESTVTITGALHGPPPPNYGYNNNGSPLALRPSPTPSAFSGGSDSGRQVLVVGGQQSHHQMNNVMSVYDGMISPPMDNQQQRFVGETGQHSHSEYFHLRRNHIVLHCELHAPPGTMSAGGSGGIGSMENQRTEYGANIGTGQCRICQGCLLDQNNGAFTLTPR